ncbi:MAG: exonuclease domain-containing protein [Anaerotignum sp.]
MNYIVLDLEFNQSFPFKTGKTALTVPECPFEIIQIGAVKLNASFEKIGSFNAMIKPQIYPRIHPYVEKITGITEETLKDKQNFSDAFQDFTAFIGNEKAVLCTWGADDIKSLFRNVLYFKLDADSITNHYLNVQTFATAFLKYDAGKAIGLKNAVTELNIDMNFPFHDAFYDASYTAEVFKIVRPKEITPALFKPTTLLVTLPKPPRTNTPTLLRHVSELMERKLTTQEKKLVKLAYFLGRAHTFDASEQEKNKTQHKK